MKELGLQPKPVVEPAVGVCVCLKGVPGRSDLDGTGAVLRDGPRERHGQMEWEVQPEAADAPTLTVGEDCFNCLPPLPTLGVSSDCLRHFFAAYRSKFDEGATTTNVCMDVVLDLTGPSRASVADCLQRMSKTHPDAGKWIGPATVFVSHAWRYKAFDVFSAMLAFAEREESANQPPHYFWFDLFTNDQHDATTLPQIWWREAFLQGVKRIGHTLLVLSPWHDPIPLTRAWCLWEILSTMRVKSQLTVEMVPSQAANFTQTLSTDFEAVVQAVSRVDGRRADGWKAADVAMIKGAVEADIGFTELNSMISTRLREWLYEQGRAALEAVPAAERAESALAYNLALLLHKQGRLDEAEALLRDCLRQSEETIHHEEESADANATARIINVHMNRNELARVLAARGVYGEAEPLLRQAIDGMVKLEGATSAKALVITNNLAEMLLQQKRPSEAEPLLVSILDAGDVEGMEVSRLSVMGNLGQVYVQLGKHAEAEPLFRQVYAERVEKLGPRHADTLTAGNNLGAALRTQKKLDEAEPLYKEVLAFRQETLGKEHLATLDSCNNYAVLLSEMRTFNEALPFLLQALSGYRAQLGDAHPNVVPLVINTAQVLFMTTAEGMDADESKAHGISELRAVLDACVTKLGETSQQAKMLAKTLIKLLRSRKLDSDEDDAAQLASKFGLE